MEIEVREVQDQKAS